MIDDYKEIAFPRHKRAGVFKDFQWLWQYDQDPYKATTDKNLNMEQGKWVGSPITSTWAFGIW